MDVKGGVAYIDFKYTDISSARTLVISNIYNYFSSAYKSKKVVVLRNLTFSSEKLPDMPITGIRRKSNSEYVIFCRLPSNTGVSVASRYITISADNTVSIANV